jgi:hypothetical protein
MANDNPHLRYGFQQLADAEGRLRNCRDSILGTVERFNLPRAEIFSDTFFVPRSVAERWLEKAEQRFLARERESAEHVRLALKRLAAKKADNNEDDDDTGDRDDPDDQGDDSPTEPTDKSKKKSKKKAAPTDEDVEAGEAAAARFFRSRDSGAATAAAVRDAETARAIIAAGAKRRGEPAPRPAWEGQGNHPKPSNLTVVPGAPLPENPTARAIVLAGQRRRG